MPTGSERTKSAERIKDHQRAALQLAKLRTSHHKPLARRTSRLSSSAWRVREGLPRCSVLAGLPEAGFHSR
jgi:hypothetical protein